MVEVIEVVMYEFRIVDKWGVYMVDNIDNCDIYIASLVRKLQPSEAITLRRSWCFTYMVNLAAKAFIYRKKAKGFLRFPHRSSVSYDFIELGLDCGVG